MPDEQRQQDANRPRGSWRQLMNGDAPGVRLKSANVRMTQKQFNGRLHRYDQQRLRLKGIAVGGKTLPRFDFVFVFRDNTAVDLMLDGRVIGSAIWSDGTVTFDPAVRPGALRLLLAIPTFSTSGPSLPTIET